LSGLPLGWRKKNKVLCTMRRLGPSLSTAAASHTIAASLPIPVGNLDNAGALHEIRLPRASFEDGARVLSLSRETYVGTDWYRDSVRAFFWALKVYGVKTILL
jgi:hypothetical protein